MPLALSNLTFLGIGDAPLTFDFFDIPKQLVMRVFTLTGLCAWLIQLLLRGGKVRLGKTDFLVLAFLAWVGLSTVTSIHPPTSVFGKYRRAEGLLTYLNYAAVYFLTVQLVDRPAKMRSLLRTLFFSSVVVAAYGVLQYLGIEPVTYAVPPFEANRSFSTFGNPDILGGFLMFAVPLSFALALSEEDRVWRLIYWAGSLLNVVVLITAFTRGAWVGAAVAFLLLAVVAVRQRVTLRREDYAMLGASAVLGGAVFVRSLSATSAVMNVGLRLKSIFAFGEGSALTRFQIWRAAADAVAQRPITGFGPDTLRLWFGLFKPAAYVGIAGFAATEDNAHNYVLHMASTLGIPGRPAPDSARSLGAGG